ncbi:MAG: N-acetylmuramoyl-L-alanine amidase [Hydrogenoanaerobacterium sp.]
MNTIQKKFFLTAIVLSFLGLAAAMCIMFRINRTKPVLAGVQVLPSFVIDAGHGGMDGGAVGIHNELEKDINLAVAVTLNDMLKAGGYSTVMVRSDDISVHDPVYTSARQQKISDIKNRLKLAEETPNAVFVSIHQNLFRQQSCNGAQIFYSKNNPQSAALAEALRLQFKTILMPQNERAIKQAQKNLYILYHATCPAVLVECGFLSNPKESILLSDEEYQHKVAFTIFIGLISYLQDYNLLYD